MEAESYLTLYFILEQTSLSAVLCEISTIFSFYYSPEASHKYLTLTFYLFTFEGQGRTLNPQIFSNQSQACLDMGLLMRGRTEPFLLPLCM